MLILSNIIYAQLMPKLAVDGVELYGSMYYCDQWSVDTYVSDSAGLYMFPAGGPAHVHYKAPIIISGGSTYHDGKIYCNVFNDDGRIDEQTPEWRIYDLESGELLKSITLKNNWANVSNSMTYDETTDKIYALARTNFNDFYLACIDPETAEWQHVGTLPGNWYTAIACDKYGDLYALGEGPSLVRINKANAETRTIGGITVSNLLEGDELIMMSSRGGIFFNKADNKLYWMLASSSLYLGDLYTAIIEINTNTGKGNMVGYLAKEYVMTGTFLTEPIMTSPAGIEDFKFTFNTQGSNEGKFTFTAPEKTYEGKTLNGKLRIEIVEKKEVIASIDDVTPGESVEIDNIAIPNGQHELMYRAYNSDGEKGVTQKYQLYSGYDLPYYPQNVRLTADGLKLTLEWEAPETGIHGMPIDQDNLTYRIVRYPDQKVVEQDYKGTVYTEEIPEDLVRYSYMVVARYNGNDGYATFSNSIIAGNPLELPFQTTFDSAEELFNYFKIIDNNQDSYTWTYDDTEGEKNVCYVYNANQGADDWLFTPPAIYEAGIEYDIEFTASSSYSEQLEKLEITFGEDNTIESQQVILDIPEVSYEGAKYKATAKAQKDGVNFFALHIYSDAMGGFLRIDDLSIKKSKDSAVNDISTDNITIKTGYRNITVSNPANLKVRIYSVNGYELTESDDSEITATADQGLYIVQCNGKVWKVIVR